MTMRNIAPAGPFRRAGTSKLGQGRKKNARNTHGRGGVDKAGKKSGQGALELIKRTVQVILEKETFSFFSSSFGLPKKRLAGRRRTTL